MYPLFRVLFLFISMISASAYGNAENHAFLQPNDSDNSQTQQDFANNEEVVYELLKLRTRITDLEAEINSLQNNIRALDITQAQLLKKLNQISPDAPINDSLISTNSQYLYDQSFKLLQSGDLDSAQIEFQRFLQLYPEDPAVGEVYFWLGEIEYRRAEYKKASIHYITSYRQYPNNSRANDALFKLSISLGFLSQNSEACTGFSTLLAKARF